ncbi:unnamed protein product [Rotaria sp. Silwood2]|nr:unnamed protein product [Rotaria sp. Silwood2]CAF4289818.1 unnamed protein product [Rotaria sp. Silwood2]
MHNDGGSMEKNESTVTIRSAKQSRVWAYFERIYGDEGLRAKCLVGDCSKILSTPLHSTSTLIRHLRDVHELDEFKPKEKLVYRSKHKHIPVKLKKQLDRAVVTAIIEDGRSFGDFSKSGFRKFIQLALPGYKPPHRISISTQLKRLHTKHFFIMVNSLSKLLCISVSTDFWSDNKGISFLVLTGHYVTNDFVSKSTILRFCSFEKRHFSHLIGSEIEKLLIELQVFDKVTSITCDSAPNMIKMFDYFSRLDITRIRCHAHLLHLIVCNGLGLWIDNKEKIKATTNDTNLHDSEIRLSDSLQKINIIDDEQLINEVHVVQSDGEHPDTDDEREDSDEEDNNNINQDDDGGNFSDEGDSISINSESDIEGSDDSYQNNFEVGIDVHPSETSDLLSPEPDPRICLVVEKSRQLIDIIKDSSILSSFIKKKKQEYNQYNDSKVKCSLFLDVRTRWNSTYKMLHTLNIYRPIIIELFQNKTNLDITKKQQQRLNALELRSDCWYVIELLIKILKPFYRATKAISGSDYPTIGITLFIFRRLEKDLLSNISPTDDPLFNNMKECLLSKMIYYNMLYGYFDPYGISVMTNNEINKIENEIKYIIRQQTSNSSTQASSTTSSNTNGSSATENEKKKSLLNYFLDSLADEDTQHVKKQSSTLNKILNDEFKTYKKLAGHFVSTSTDLHHSLQFWKTNKSLLPNLAPLAQKYLASPSTSTKSESAFSMSAYYGRKQRARLSSENLGFSVFLKDKLSNEN